MHATGEGIRGKGLANINHKTNLHIDRYNREKLSGKEIRQYESPNKLTHGHIQPKKPVGQRSALIQRKKRNAVRPAQLEGAAGQGNPVTHTKEEEREQQSTTVKTKTGKHANTTTHTHTHNQTQTHTTKRTQTTNKQTRTPNEHANNKP